MIRRLPLRARLTLLVSVVFGAAVVVTSVVVLRSVEADLIADTEASAEALLADYLDSIYGGTASLGVIDATDTGRFFYLDAEGSELTPRQYFEMIVPALEIGGPVLAAGSVEVIGDVPFPDVVFDEVAGPIQVDPDTGALLDESGSTVSFLSGPRPVGEAHSVDVGPGIVGVAQTLEFPDGTTVDVGVSSPLSPVTDGLDAVRTVLWIAVPVLILGIAATTWMATARALAPVHRITRRAREITAANLAERVPVPDANDEVGELAVTVNDMLARLEASQMTQRRLVSDVSHELRSPVAVSRAQLEVARSARAPDWSATADTVLAEQEHLSCLIDDLLVLSRMDERPVDDDEDVDLDELIAAEARRVRPFPVSTVIEHPARISCNERLVQRALRNLVSNAVRHAASRVEIGLSVGDGVAAVTVDDDGPGIRECDRDRVFERFTRLDSARARQTGGTGLGLAIVRGVAESHEGSVAVADGPLGGARFVLALPLRLSG